MGHNDNEVWNDNEKTKDGIRAHLNATYDPGNAPTDGRSPGVPLSPPLPLRSTPWLEETSEPHIVVVSRCMLTLFIIVLVLQCLHC